MLRREQFPFCSEFYSVERTVEVVVRVAGEPATIRIEALRGDDGKYCTRAYIQSEITVQLTYPQTAGAFSSPPASHSIWTKYELPWTERDSADEVLGQALGFLRSQVDS